ncbi:MAG: extracellular solute-binding protein [Polyangiaceae bacterium]
MAAILFFLALLFVRPLSQLAIPRPPGTRLVLWHSYRGDEQSTLERLLREFNERHAGRIVVEPLAVPDAAFKDKVRRSIQHGTGPDLFIRPHNEIGELLDADVLSALAEEELPALRASYLPGLVDGVSDHGRLVGVPLTFKGLVQFYDRRLLPGGLASTRDLERLTRELPAGVFPLAYDATSLYFHSPFFLAASGHVFDESGTHFTLFDEPARRSFDWPGDWKSRGILPPDTSYNEAVRLFEAGQAAVFVCGPWYRPGGAIGESQDWDVAPLFDVDGVAAGSFVTIEAAFVSKATKVRAEAIELARFLGSEDAQRDRLEQLSLPPLAADLYHTDHHMVLAQRYALEHGQVTPNSLAMGAAWRPALDVLSASVAGRSVDDEIVRAKETLAKVEVQRTAPASATVYGVLLVAVLLVGSVLVVRQVRRDVASPDAARMRMLGFFGRVAVPYLAPGVLAVALLVVVPLVVSAGMSLFVYERGSFVFVGMANFKDILFVSLSRAFEARSFYFALAVTILWTLVNVFLHVSIGVALALLLRRPFLRFKTAYRLVLILPWAIPNYITALVWKGMFHAQVGAINKLLAPFGFEGKNWFDHFGTAFFANVVTNTWLGFPFMMVVTLGALSQIPTDLEEAAILDGASRWTRFTRIVLPHIRPALLPSVLLGSVWTFNMFNVVYLVSGGEPGSQTDILVSEAYRWAFERGERYGYAAAYSVLIFAFLLIYGRFTRRMESK